MIEPVAGNLQSQKLHEDHLLKARRLCSIYKELRLQGHADITLQTWSSDALTGVFALCDFYLLDKKIE